MGAALFLLTVPFLFLFRCCCVSAGDDQGAIGFLLEFVAMPLEALGLGVVLSEFHLPIYLSIRHKILNK